MLRQQNTSDLHARATFPQSRANAVAFKAFTTQQPRPAERLKLGACKSRCARTAFTLLELLLAAGITTFVLATLMTAITFVARTEGSSADRVELTRLGTALLQLLERDLGAIVVVAEVTEESTRQVESDEAVDAEAVDDLVVFLGASDRIDLVGEGALTDTKRLLEMAAWSDSGEEWDGGFGPKRRLISWGALTSEFGDDLALRQSSVFSSDGLSATVVYENVIPELSEIQFRFLSDGEWVDTWNSADNGGLPAAVEVSLALQTTTEGSELTGVPVTWQRVITVPQGRYPAATSATDAAEAEL